MKIYNSEYLKNYYKDWHYLGIVEGMDGYCHIRGGTITLSLVYGYEEWEYISPMWTTDQEQRRWYCDYSSDAYKLLIRVDKFLKELETL